MLGGSVARDLEDLHKAELEAEAAKEYGRRLREGRLQSPRDRRRPPSVALDGGKKHRALLWAGERGLTLQSLSSAVRRWRADPTAKVGLRRVDAPSLGRKALDARVDAVGREILARARARPGDARSHAVLLSWPEVRACKGVGDVAHHALDKVTRSLKAPPPEALTPAKAAFFRFDADDSGSLDRGEVALALKSMPRVALARPDPEEAVSAFYAATGRDERNPLDLDAFGALVDAVDPRPDAPDGDKDALGALSATFAESLLASTGALASWGLAYRGGVELNPLVRPSASVGCPRPRRGVVAATRLRRRRP